MTGSHIPGPYRQNGNYISGNDRFGLPLYLGKVFESAGSEKQISATARLWALSATMLEVLEQVDQLSDLEDGALAFPDDQEIAAQANSLRAQVRALTKRILNTLKGDTE